MEAPPWTLTPEERAGGGGSVSGVRCDAVGTAAAFFLSLSLSPVSQTEARTQTQTDATSPKRCAGATSP